MCGKHITLTYRKSNAIRLGCRDNLGAPRGWSIPHRVFCRRRATGRLGFHRSKAGSGRMLKQTQSYFTGFCLVAKIGAPFLSRPPVPFGSTGSLSDSLCSSAKVRITILFTIFHQPYSSSWPAVENVPSLANVRMRGEAPSPCRGDRPWAGDQEIDGGGFVLL